MSEHWLVSVWDIFDDVFQEACSTLSNFVTSLSKGGIHGCPTWAIILILGVGAILFLPLSYITYIRYRIWRVGARLSYTEVYPWWYCNLFIPAIVYKGMFISTIYPSKILELENFEVRSDDVIVIGFPRSGTNWTQEMVYLVMNDANTEKALSEQLDVRVPNVELWTTNLRELTNRPSVRVYKTHLHYQHLSREVEIKQPKIVYVMRNPKDVAVSYYNLLTKFFIPIKEDFDTFVNCFLEDKVPFSPWSDHVKGFWEKRHHGNILLVKYEEMRKDIDGAVRKLASFLGKTLTDEQIQTIAQHCSFDNMKQNDKTNYSWKDTNGFTKNMGNSFIRKGKVGDWMNTLSPEQSARMDKMVDEAFRGTGLTFQYDA